MASEEGNPNPQEQQEKSSKDNENESKKRRRDSEEEEANENEKQTAAPPSIATIDHWKKHALGPFQDPFDMEDDKFQEMFGFDKIFVRKFMKAINEHLPIPQRTKAIPNELKILATLRFLISGHQQKGVGNDSALSLSQASVSRCVLYVAQAVCDALEDKWLRFPQNDAERKAISRRFEELCNVPNIMGSVAFWCPPVNVPTISEQVKKYVKEVPSKAVQIVSDGDLRIINVYVGECKMYDPNELWLSSDVNAIMKNRHEDGFTHDLIIASGNTPYNPTPWLICPQFERFLEFNLGEAQTAGSRCLDDLRAMFGCLKSNKVLLYSPRYMVNIIKTCAILYNMHLHSKSEKES